MDRHDGSDGSQDRTQRAQVSPFPLWIGLLTAAAIGIYVGAKAIAELGVVPG